MNIIKNLMMAIETFANTISGTKTTAWGIPLPLDWLFPGASGLATHCKQAKEDLDRAKSTRVHVVNE